ncbi:uncharacterized protein LOC106011530 [Aplysia californica]|uniref:Uncharacterized protein LOC106011530 n=1 Tax=Aplysia californica TaxID=6500 RepID=A0ABM0ZYA4_APLCA|nr:uncharacterized protein LOC106011530 [Aplysia californica]
MEGAWISSTEDLNEPFESDRHHLDAKDWFDLQVGGQFARRRTLDEYMKLRGARFNLNRHTRDQFDRWDLLDEIMAEIPGKDNYGAVLRDSTFNLNTLDVHTGQELNAANYHRWYLLAEDGAMGSNIAHRGFNDRNLFVAQNTRPEVAGISYLYCAPGQSEENGDCTMESAKVSYAFPLEIIYLTPLHDWNPLNIAYKGEANTPEGRTVLAGGRDGTFRPNKALNGTNRRTYYRTPSAFFSDGEINSDAADTLDAFVAVLDVNGEVQNVTASGVRIHLPAIPEY